MPTQTNIDWSVKKNLHYIIMLFIFNFVIPHLVMSMPQFPELVPQHWTAFDGYAPVRIYWVCVWLGVPLSGGIITLWHVQKDGQFCPIFVIEAALAILTYRFRIKLSFVFTLLLSSVLIILLMEFFALLGGYDGHKAKEAKGGVLAEMAENRKFLALLCFWSVILLFVIQIVSNYLALWHVKPIPILLLPFPMLLPLLPVFQEKQLKERPLTTGGLVGFLFLFALSCLLSTTFYMNSFWIINLSCVVISYMFLFLMTAAVGGT